MTGSAGRAGRFYVASSSSLREEVQEERGAILFPGRDPDGFLGVVFLVLFSFLFQGRFFDGFLMIF